MEEVKEEVKIKQELKEEYILPLIESGVDLENIISTVKKEDEKFIEALVNVAKEEKLPVKLDSETKPSILTSLVKSCSGQDVRNDQKDPGIKKKNALKTEVKSDGKKSVSCVAETSHEADSEDTVEDILPENYVSDGMENILKNTAYLKNIPDNPSSPLTSNPSQVKKVSVKERKYMCRYCDKKFPQSDILRRHICTRTGERPYECSFCWKRFMSEIFLNRHMLNHTGKPCCCSICGKRFLQSQGLKDHMLIHEGKRPFKCAQCGKAFRQKCALLRHIKCIHMRSQQNEENHLGGEKLMVSESIESDHSLQQQVNNIKLNKSFKCSDCGDTFTRRDGLLEHINNLHPSNSFTCDDCGKTFKCRDSIVEHIMKTIHNQEYKGRYCCRVCGLESKTKSNWKKHEQLHEDVYPLKCKHCNMSFKQKINLKSHYKLAHESEKPYKCADCGSSFKCKGNLVSHIEVHHSNMGKMFSCHICNLEFKRKCYLKRHVETHTDADKRHVCDDCGLRCRSKTDIAKHVLTHLGAVERPHSCEVCGAGFTKPSHLVRHRRVHSDEKTFRCELCDKAYKDTASLKIHHETVHCGASFSCQGCGFSSTNRQSFSRHLRRCEG